MQQEHSPNGRGVTTAFTHLSPQKKALGANCTNTQEVDRSEFTLEEENNALRNHIESLKKALMEVCANKNVELPVQMSKEEARFHIINKVNMHSNGSGVGSLKSSANRSPQKKRNFNENKDSSPYKFLPLQAQSKSSVKKRGTANGLSSTERTAKPLCERQQVEFKKVNQSTSSQNLLKTRESVLENSLISKDSSQIQIKYAKMLEELGDAPVGSPEKVELPVTEVEMIDVPAKDFKTEQSLTDTQENLNLADYNTGHDGQTTKATEMVNKSFASSNPEAEFTLNKLDLMSQTQNVKGMLEGTKVPPLQVCHLKNKQSSQLEQRQFYENELLQLRDELESMTREEETILAVICNTGRVDTACQEPADCNKDFQSAEDSARNHQSVLTSEPIQVSAREIIQEATFVKDEEEEEEKWSSDQDGKVEIVHSRKQSSQLSVSHRYRDSNPGSAYANSARDLVDGQNNALLKNLEEEVSLLKNKQAHTKTVSMEEDASMLLKPIKINSPSQVTNELEETSNFGTHFKVDDYESKDVTSAKEINVQSFRPSSASIVNKTPIKEVASGITEADSQRPLDFGRSPNTGFSIYKLFDTISHRSNASPLKFLLRTGSKNQSMADLNDLTERAMEAPIIQEDLPETYGTQGQGSMTPSITTSARSSIVLKKTPKHSVRQSVLTGSSHEKAQAPPSQMIMFEQYRVGKKGIVGEGNPMPSAYSYSSSATKSRQSKSPSHNLLANYSQKKKKQKQSSATQVYRAPLPEIKVPQTPKEEPVNHQVEVLDSTVEPQPIEDSLFFGMYTIEKSEKLKEQRNESIRKAEQILNDFNQQMQRPPFLTSSVIAVKPASQTPSDAPKKVTRSLSAAILEGSGNTSPQNAPEPQKLTVAIQAHVAPQLPVMEAFFSDREKKLDIIAQESIVEEEFFKESFEPVQIEEIKEDGTGFIETNFTLGNAYEYSDDPQLENAVFKDQEDVSFRIDMGTQLLGEKLPEATQSLGLMSSMSCLESTEPLNLQLGGGMIGNGFNQPFETLEYENEMSSSGPFKSIHVPQFVKQAPRRKSLNNISSQHSVNSSQKVISTRRKPSIVDSNSPNKSFNQTQSQQYINSATKDTLVRSSLNMNQDTDIMENASHLDAELLYEKRSKSVIKRKEELNKKRELEQRLKIERKYNKIETLRYTRNQRLLHQQRSVQNQPVRYKSINGTTAAMKASNQTIQCENNFDQTSEDFQSSTKKSTLRKSFMDVRRESCVSNYETSENYGLSTLSSKRHQTPINQTYERMRDDGLISAKKGSKITSSLMSECHSSRQLDSGSKALSSQKQPKALIQCTNQQQAKLKQSIVNRTLRIMRDSHNNTTQFFNDHATRREKMNERLAALVAPATNAMSNPNMCTSVVSSNKNTAQLKNNKILRTSFTGTSYTQRKTLLSSHSSHRLGSVLDSASRRAVKRLHGACGNCGRLKAQGLSTDFCLEHTPSKV